MIELCCEYLSERRIWVYVITMSCTRFRENYHSIVAWMSMNSLLETDRMYDVMASVWSKEFLDIQATIKCRFTLKRVRDMIKTYSQMHRTDKYSQHSSIIWPVWLNGWVFVYELSGCGFESSCSHLNVRSTLASSKEFFDIQATIECRFTLKHVRDMIITYSYS